MTGPDIHQRTPEFREGIQYTPANLDRLQAWLARICPGEFQFAGDGSDLLLVTTEGDREVQIDVGYYIMRDSLGHPYPVHPDEYANGYQFFRAGE